MPNAFCPMKADIGVNKLDGARRGTAPDGPDEAGARPAPDVRARRSGGDTTQIYTSIRPPQLKRAVSFYEEQATRMLVERNESSGTQTSVSVANGRTRNR